MSFKLYVVKRFAWVLLAMWLVLSASFLLFALAPDPNVQVVSFFSGEEAAGAYQEARNYDEPLLDRYVEWVGSFATLDFGQSAQTGESTRAMLAERIPRTLAYLVPAIVLATVAGALVGLAAAMNRGGPFDRVATLLSYSGMAIPAFLLGELMLVTLVIHWQGYPRVYDAEAGTLTAHNLKVLALPAVVTLVNMLVVQVRYARAESLEYVPADFVKTLTASGAGAVGVARHVFRNASLPLVSLFFTETLTVLFVTSYVVEYVFNIPGVGQMALQAIQARDPAPLLAGAFLPVYLGLLGSFAQDVLYTWLDPRIEYGESAA